MWFAGKKQIMFGKVRNVFLVVVLVVAVGVVGHLEAVDQARSLGGASAAVVGSWDAWRHGNPGSVAADGGSDYQHVCRWDASVSGNGVGGSYVLVDGRKVLEW
jgi:hypothetical protein